MNNSAPEGIRTWFRRVEGIYPELFNAAHVMCGNYDLAEYALRAALLNVYSEGSGSGMGFRERIRGEVRRQACSIALGDEGQNAELTWPQLQYTSSQDPVLSQVSQESAQMQRMLMLYFGCGLPPRSIAQLTDLSASQVRTGASRFAARCRRLMPKQDRSRAEALIARRMRAALAHDTTAIPSKERFFRSFEAEASATQVSGRRISRFLSHVVALLLAVLCAGVFWLFAITARSGDTAGQLDESTSDSSISVQSPSGFQEDPGMYPESPEAPDTSVTSGTADTVYETNGVTVDTYTLTEEEYLPEP